MFSQGRAAVSIGSLLNMTMSHNRRCVWLVQQIAFRSTWPHTLGTSCMGEHIHSCCLSRAYTTCLPSSSQIIHQVCDNYCPVLCFGRRRARGENWNQPTGNFPHRLLLPWKHLVSSHQRSVYFTGTAVHSCNMCQNDHLIGLVRSSHAVFVIMIVCANKLTMRVRQPW